MPLFQDVGKRFTDAAKAVSKRTTEATEVVKMNSRLTAIQDDMERCFNQIGKAYYAVRGTTGECDAARALCEKVDALYAELNEVKGEVDRIRNIRRCPNCGDVQGMNSIYCATCGTKMPELPKPKPKPVKPPVEMPVQAESEAEGEDEGDDDFKVDWSLGNDDDEYDGDADEEEEDEEEGAPGVEIDWPQRKNDEQ